MSEAIDLPDDLIHIHEAAKLAKCGTQAVHRWIFKGRIRGWRRCGRWFVSQAEVLGLFKPIRTQAQIREEKWRKRVEAIEQGAREKALSAEQRAAEARLRAAGILV